MPNRSCAEYWPAAVHASQKFSRMCDCLIAARALIERQWAGNLELPISRLCELEPFLWFVGHVLAHLPRFCEIHNQVLAEYRAVNHVRSRTHPVPELKTKDGWVEAPFWISAEGGRRPQPALRPAGWPRGAALRRRTRIRPLAPFAHHGRVLCRRGASRIAQAGNPAPARALTTTLFARLCLADLFVHGIGGAKYDEMTDRILLTFFGVPVPGFLTMTATLYPSLAEPFPVAPEDEDRLLRLFCDLRWNPDRHIATDRPEVARLVEEKKPSWRRSSRRAVPATRGERGMPAACQTSSDSSGFTNSTGSWRLSPPTRSRPHRRNSSTSATSSRPTSFSRTANTPSASIRPRNSAA